MQIIYKNDPIYNLLDNKYTDKMISYESISDSVTDYIINSILNNGSDIKDEDVKTDIKRFNKVLEVIYDDINSYLKRLNDNGEDFKKVLSRDLTVSPEEIYFEVSDNFVKSTLNDFKKGLIEDLFNGFIEKKYITDSLDVTNVSISNFTFNNILKVILSSGTVKFVDEVPHSNDLNPTIPGKINYVTTQWFVDCPLGRLFNSRKGFEKISDEDVRDYGVRDVMKHIELVKSAQSRTEYYKQIARVISDGSNNPVNGVEVDINVNLTYDFGKMFTNLKLELENKVRNLESFEMCEIFPLNEYYERSKSIESSELTRTVNTTLKPFGINEITAKVTEFVPSLIGSISKFYKEFSDDRRDACIRKVTPYIIQLKDDIAKAFDKIIKINDELSKYYTSREDLISADIYFGSRKSIIGSQLNKIDNVESFVTQFIFEVYELTKRNSNKRGKKGYRSYDNVTFYFDMVIALDIPKKDTSKYYIEQNKDIVNMIKPLFPTFNSQSFSKIKHYRKQDSTIYDLTFKVEFTEQDYVNVFEGAKEIADLERKEKGLENYKYSFMND